MFRKIILLMVAFLASHIVNGQNNHCTWTLQGIVGNNAKEPLRAVEIRISPSNISISTDRKGKFQVKDLCPGTYEVEFSYLGYETKREQIHIEKDTYIEVNMDLAEIHIQDVQVNGYQSDQITSSRHMLSQQELEENRGKMLAEMLSEIAGVTQLNTGSNIIKPVINGLHSNRILLLNNGVRQEGQQWGAEHAPEIDPFTADRIEVIKGAQAIRYGADALGGVIITSPGSISTETVSGRADLLAQSNGKGILANVRLEGGVQQVDNLSWRIQASTKKRGNTKTADYYMGNTGLEELNFSGLVHYGIKKHDFELFYSHFRTNLGIFYGAHVSTIDDIMANIQRGRPLTDYDFSYAIGSPRQRVDHDLAKLKWSYAISGNTKIEGQYALQSNRRKEYDLRRVLSDDVPMADMSLTTQSFDLALKTGHHQIGINGMLQINNNVPGTGTTPIIPNFDNHNMGLYGLSQYHWGKFHAEMGMRYDYRYFDVAGYRYDYSRLNESGAFEQYLLTDTRHFHNVSGSLGLAYHFSPRWMVKSNIGLAWRAPSANELYSDGLHHGSGTYEIGDRNLKSERGLKWISNILYSNEKTKFNLDIYGQYIDGYIYASPNPDSVRQTIRGTFPVFNYRQNNAFFYGVDASFELDITPDFTYSFKGSVVRAKELDNDTYLPYIPADRLQQGLQWNIDRGQQRYIRFSHVYVAKQNRFDPATDYTNPPPAYHLFDFYANSTLPLGKHKLQSSVSIENIFNVLYKDYMDRFRYFTHQPGRNITLGLTYHF